MPRHRMAIPGYLAYSENRYYWALWLSGPLHHARVYRYENMAIWKYENILIFN